LLGFEVIEIFQENLINVGLLLLLENKQYLVSYAQSQVANEAHACNSKILVVKKAINEVSCASHC
jgi:hypothetical protein